MPREMPLDRPAGDLLLYDAPGSPCARRVRIVLLEKGLSWETRLVDLTKLEQKRPEYLKLNPNGVVPTLVHGDRVVYESNVITEYLDDVFPTPRLYPADPWRRAQAKMWQAFELAMAKEYRPLMYLRVIGPYDRLQPKEDVMAAARRSTDDPAHLDWVSRVWDGTAVGEDEARYLDALLLLRLDRLEEALAGCEFLVGNECTIADLSVYPRVAMYPLVQLPLDPERHPNVAGWLARVGARPSLVQSEGVRPG
jgi:glutathione S-transferase